MKKRNEQELIQRLKTGEEKAFEEMIMHYGKDMKIAARNFLKNDDEQKDVIQEVLMDLWVTRTTRKIRNLGGYLNRSIWYKSIDLLSKRAREEANKREYAKVMPINIRNAASRLRMMKQLEKKLEKMPEGIDRDIFDALVEEKSHEDIATKLNIKIAHVKYVRKKYIDKLKK